jgi:hypothetical protein
MNSALAAAVPRVDKKGLVVVILRKIFERQADDPFSRVVKYNLYFVGLLEVLFIKHNILY